MCCFKHPPFCEALSIVSFTYPFSHAQCPESNLCVVVKVRLGLIPHECHAHCTPAEPAIDTSVVIVVITER